MYLGCMLTKTDLSHIQKVVRTETRTIVQEEFEPVKKDIGDIKKDINLIVRTFDRDYVLLRRKLEEHIEKHPYSIATSS